MRSLNIAHEMRAANDRGNQKKTVLVVDDAPANIQIVNSILKDIYKIRIATNGAKALELAKLHLYLT